MKQRSKPIAALVAVAAITGTAALAVADDSTGLRVLSAEEAGTRLDAARTGAGPAVRMPPAGVIPAGVTIGREVDPADPPAGATPVPVARGELRALTARVNDAPAPERADFTTRYVGEFALAGKRIQVAVTEVARRNRSQEWWLGSGPVTTALGPAYVNDGFVQLALGDALVTVSGADTETLVAAIALLGVR